MFKKLSVLLTDYVVSGSGLAAQCPDVSQIGIISSKPVKISVPAGWKVIEEISQEVADKWPPNVMAFFVGVSTVSTKVSNNTSSPTKAKIDYCGYIFRTESGTVSEDEEFHIRPVEDAARTANVDNLLKDKSWNLMPKDPGDKEVFGQWFYCSSLNNVSKCSW